MYMPLIAALLFAAADPSASAAVAESAAPHPKAPRKKPGKPAMTGVLNVNRATEAELRLLPGIGKKRAELNRRYVGFVFQSYHLLDNLTVQENIDVPLSYRDIPRAQRASMVADITANFNSGRSVCCNRFTSPNATSLSRLRS